ncbi:protocadherin gamma-C5-like isoform X5 [Sceloporus undulatus]|uniref:protocadherin gamma-C5-like isoform X5 n=1 Tax=Sceloporus undulatus TaxID=8520 RepID=UPI001C4D2294|nr:protocadherin gamma-C5-like isoform X5 [Sceloporus undulatus]
MRSSEERQHLQWQVRALLLVSVSLRIAGEMTQLHYSIPEELPPGAFVGDVAKDLGLTAAQLVSRQLRIMSGTVEKYFEVKAQNGALVLKERLDREELCGPSLHCLLYLELLLANPTASYRVEVDLLDVNDNDPMFLTTITHLEIAESAVPGARFPLETAEDLDIGTNSVSTYQLSPRGQFSLSIKSHKGGSKPELILEKALDREQQQFHHMVLTALDGGVPAKSGTAKIVVSVIDANDNPPVFNQSVYKVTLLENTPVGALVVHLHAIDKDEGPNGKVSYSFSSHTPQKIRKIFSLGEETGEVRVMGTVDYEEDTSYEIDVRAKDQGSPSMDTHCNILVEVIDVNDNAPQIRFISLIATIPEDAPPGTTAGLLRVSDGDSGRNGEVQLHLPEDIPFQIVPSFKNHYSLITSGPLDREEISQYKVIITATDSGSPPLSSQSSFLLNISDLNDNPPSFLHSAYQTLVTENNALGIPIISISAFDPDLGQNSQLSYSLVEKIINGMPVSSYVYITENGTIYSGCSFDYEKTQQLAFQIQAKDNGTPALSTNVTVSIFIVDQNDNAPLIVYPVMKNGVLAQQSVPFSAQEGYLVTKVTAVDADSGQNAWVSYKLQKATDPSLFKISTFTGEIRTIRALMEQDAPSQEVVVEILDNGIPPLSATATLMLNLEREHELGMAELRKSSIEQDGLSNLTLHLIIALIAISALSTLAFIFLTVKCLKRLRSRHTDVAWTSDMKGRNPMAMGGHFDTFSVHLSPEEKVEFPTAFIAEDASPFTLLRPSQAHFLEGRNVRIGKPVTQQDINNTDTLLASSLSQEPNEQAQPNTDWRFSQAQRPGTSGSQNGDENGTWPNNQFDTEMLQAMILASANEAAAAAAANPDGNSTLGGGAVAGTMGLSTRYGPQFTLQHVPDYRQNVYIPGSTATLSNSSGKRDGKPAASGGGNKKKSGKKEKK